MSSNPYRLEERVCAEGCGIRFWVDPGSSFRVARWDCHIVCKKAKPTKAEFRRRAEIGRAQAQSKTAVFYHDGRLGGRTEDELRAARIGEERLAREAATVTPTPEILKAEPLWYQRWDAVVRASEKLGTEATVDDCLCEANLTKPIWYTVLAKARVEIPDEVATLYKLQGWVSRNSPSVEEAEAEEETEAEEEAPEPTEAPAEVSVGEAMAAATAWLEKLSGDERRRAFVATGIMLGFDEVVSLLAPPVRAVRVPRVKPELEVKKRRGRPPGKKRRSVS